MPHRVVVTVVTALLTGVLAALLAAPRPPHLGRATTGDAALAADLRAAAGDPDGYRGLAVALIGPGGVRTAGIGDRGDGTPVTADTPFEIGSIVKTFTGMLLADSSVEPDERLRALVPSIGGPTGDVTVAELASHRAGLRSVPIGSAGQAARLWSARVSGADPYRRQHRGWLLHTAAGQRPGDAGTVHYSNFGVAVLGQALAERAGVPYQDLLRRRLLDPLGMAATTVNPDGTALPAGRATGGTAAGREVDPWRGEGWAPAGIGVWSTAADLARLVTAVQAGTAPGIDALTPRFDTGDGGERIGYGWFTTRYGGTALTWHNGGTGGFRSFLAVDRATGRGVVVLGNTDRDVDPIGRRLLGVTPSGATGPERTPLAVLLAVGLSFLGAAGLLITARSRTDRVRLATSMVWAVVMPLLAHRAGDWLAVPGLVWALGVAASAAVLCVAVPRWRDLPLVAGRPWWRWTAAAFSGAAAVAAVLLVM
ncbi:serine hydrolase domain-containing protein [Dactylosporangium sp. NPDC006015]|uniref:serine hydrolase domain-containing protein n=1 Tax=Dactylosporangium sp. NPDC006015 TaxID=3154576 RepID=UPI0033AE4D47